MLHFFNDKGISKINSNLLSRNQYFLLQAAAAVSIIFIITMCQTQTPTYKDANAPIEKRIQDLLARMTIDEKIGQMVQSDMQFPGLVDQIQSHFIGSMLVGGANTQKAIAKEVANWTKGFHDLALQTRLGIPLLLGTDAVHGSASFPGAVVFPHNIGLGCTRDSVLIEEVGRITALEVLASGFNWTFSPCVSIPRNIRWGKTYEGFSESPQLVSTMGAALVRGLQDKTLTSNNKSIAACAKHYMGDGGTEHGINGGDAKISETEMRNIHLPPFAATINSGVGTVMAANCTWNGKKIHYNKQVLTDILKNELGFKGLVISDFRSIGSESADNVLQAVNAGIDMSMDNKTSLSFINHVKDHYNAGRITEERINDAVTRILRLKFELGLFENPYADENLIAKVGSDEHRAVARQAVRKSLVLLKNRENTLPLRKERIKKILVTGTHANNLGYQCGGWTIMWQGLSGNDLTKGSTIYEGLKKNARGIEVVLDSMAASTKDVDVAVICFGETPYAEDRGDTDNLSIKKSDKKLIAKLKKKGIPVVGVLVSGRPMILDETLDLCDALVAAWLPGSEGDGIADILYGDHAPTGVLSYTWPRSMKQIPIHIGDKNYNPLFKFGYGLDFKGDLITSN